MRIRQRCQGTGRLLIAALGLLVTVACGDELIGIDTGYSDADQAGHHPPAAPTGLEAVALGPTAVRLTWQDDAGNEDGFRIYRGTAPDTLVLVGSEAPNATTWTDAGLTPVTTYHYAVVAFNHEGESAPATDTVTTPAEGGGCEPPDPANRVLIDASKDGGVWWFPQSGPFDPDAPHQGQALADYLRCRGYVVTEMGRDMRMTDSLAAAHRIIIRAHRFGPAYTSAELAAYAAFLSRPTTLVLLSDHQKYTDGRDELADLVGVGFVGISDAASIVTFHDHPITAGVGAVPYMVGAYAVARNPKVVEFLGWLGNGQPAMGISTATAAKVFFLGDTNTLEVLPQPLLDNLIRWGF